MSAAQRAAFLPADVEAQIASCTDDYEWRELSGIHAGAIYR
jgi:hypothetical protein